MRAREEMCRERLAKEKDDTKYMKRLERATESGIVSEYVAHNIGEELRSANKLEKDECWATHLDRKFIKNKQLKPRPRDIFGLTTKTMQLIVPKNPIEKHKLEPMMVV